MGIFDEIRADQQHNYWRYVFANSALQGILSRKPQNAGDGIMFPIDQPVKDAVKYADALLAELERKPNG